MANQVNGIDVDVLNETIGSVKQDRELGRACFRARNKWIAGSKNLATISEFHVAKKHHRHTQSFQVRADEPPLLAGEDSAANPVEHLLAALAACLTTTMVAHAAVQGIRIDELESEVEGDLDLNGFLGLSPDTPKGYQAIRVKFTVESDAPQEELEQLARFSPVLNTILQGAKVDLRVDKASESRKIGPAEAERQAH